MESSLEFYGNGGLYVPSYLSYLSADSRQSFIQITKTVARLRRSRYYGNSDEHALQVHDTTILVRPKVTFNYMIVYSYSPPYEGMPHSPTFRHYYLHQQHSGSTHMRDWPALPPPVHQSPHQSPPPSQVVFIFNPSTSYGNSNTTTPPLSR